MTLPNMIHTAYHFAMGTNMPFSQRAAIGTIAGLVIGVAVTIVMVIMK